MRIHTRINCILFFSLLWACQPGLAKDYIVEMIFFANVPAAEEPLAQVAEPVSLPDMQDAILLDDSALLHDFLPLSLEALELADQAAALTASEKYQILEHVAWLQPGLAKRQAIPVRIQAGLDYSGEFGEHAPLHLVPEDQGMQEQHAISELDGTVKVVLGRYLHVFTDLVYRRPVHKNMSTEPVTDGLGYERVLADFPLKVHRKMRSKELHYIDHPLFGILVEIRPAQSEDETS
ncbi:MAG: hypothetical protein F4X93_05405 [Proteobacteria bacterium]|nr:hypothetical protein [Pseudomonadota bacterium]